MIPTLDEIQQAINQLTDSVLEVSKSIAWQWEYTPNERKKAGNSPSVYTYRSKHT